MKPYQFSAHDIREEGPSLPDDFIRKVLNFPKVGVKAQHQARLGAIALEQDRNSDRYHEVQGLIENLKGDIRQMQRIVATLEQEQEMRRAD